MSAELTEETGTDEVIPADPNDELINPIRAFATSFIANGLECPYPENYHSFSHHLFIQWVIV